MGESGRAGRGLGEKGPVATPPRTPPAQPPPDSDRPRAAPSLRVPVAG